MPVPHCELGFNHFTVHLIFKPELFLCISMNFFFFWGSLFEIHRFPEQSWKLMQMTSINTLILCVSHMRKMCLITVNSENYLFHFQPSTSRSQLETNNICTAGLT